MFKSLLFCIALLAGMHNLHADRALGLYKSSEGTTEKENEIIWHLKTPLHMLGFKLDLHDVSMGLPDDEKTKNAKVIISWYRSSDMKGAEKYILWLTEQLKKKKKIIIFGNFGSFKNTITNTWVKNHELNLFFENLGYKFLGNWTNKSTNIKVKKLHPLLSVDSRFEPFRKLDDYLQYKSMSKNNLELAVIERTDIKDGESVVIGITPKGGLALHPYILTKSKYKKGFEYAFEVKRFLKLSIEYKLNDSNHILCLYKSKDGQDVKENEINWHLKNALTLKGYHLNFHDISSGLPSEVESEVKAVVSWFRTPDMINPKEYISYLESMVNQGIKVIILGTMGAYKDRENKKWLEGNELNKIFNTLGVTFKGNWTNDTKLIKLSEENSSFFTNSIKEDFNEIAHYINIEPNHRSVESILVINRTDLKLGKSSPIFISPLGAYAENSFIFGKKSKPYLDIKKFVLRAIDPGLEK